MPIKDPIARAAYRQAYYAANKIKIVAATNAYRKQKAAEKKAAAALVVPVDIPRVCQECGTDATQSAFPRRGAKCKGCVAAYLKTYRENNAARIAALKKAWKLSNKEHVEEKDRAYAQAHPDRRTKARVKWSTANPGKDTASKARNAQARSKRVPTWLSVDDLWLIEQAYELAALRTKMFGFSWHVDHVLPLNGKRVSGLHVPTNLQVIPWVENLRKGNRVQHGQ